MSTAPRYQVRYRIFRPAVAPALHLFEDQRAFAFAQNQFSFETDDLVESPEGKKDRTSINISITIYSSLLSRGSQWSCGAIQTSSKSDIVRCSSLFLNGTIFRISPSEHKVLPSSVFMLAPSLDTMKTSPYIAMFSLINNRDIPQTSIC